MTIGGPVSADLGTKTTSLRVPFGHSKDSGMYSSVVFNRALVIMFNTGGCLVISLERRSVPGLNDFDNNVR
jgi:hypothetical protein